MTEQLAIIKDVSIGIKDAPYNPCLYFLTYIAEGLASAHYLTWDEAAIVLKDANISDIKYLNGKPCWVEAEGNMIKFLRIAKI